MQNVRSFQKTSFPDDLLDYMELASQSCLCDAVVGVLFDGLNSVLLHSNLLLNKPTKRDISVSDLHYTLHNQGLNLRFVTLNYFKKGGSTEYFLMKEKACLPVLAVKLRNSKGDF